MGRLVVFLMIVAGACSQTRSDDPFASYNPDDPFDDPFFNSSFQGGDADRSYADAA